VTDEALITRLAIRHSVSADAVRTVLRALRSGGGRMAQFSHADFGGMSQRSPGMTMVGDMFNNELKRSSTQSAQSSLRTSRMRDPARITTTDAMATSAIARRGAATNGGRPVSELRVP
jgi:hypothetical protein